MRPILWTFIWLPFLALVVKAFSFTSSDPSECEELKLTWDGGTGPFSALAIPVFGTPRNISIPPSAFRDGKGSYSFQLPFSAPQKILITMSDSTGFGTGGATNVLVTGPSKGTKCNTKDPGVDFSFQANTALQQCRPFVFSAYTDAIQPVTIVGIIPGGTSVVLTPPVDSDEYSWTANVAQETSMIFLMFDSRGRQGGSSDVRLVGNSDDKSCLSPSSPSSTSARPSSTSSSTSTSTGTPEKSGPPIGAIAGTAIGGFLFLAVLVTLGLFFLRKRHDAKKPAAVDLTYDPDNHANMQHFQGGGLNMSAPYPGQAPYTASTPYSGATSSSPFLPHNPQRPDYNPFTESHSALAPPPQPPHHRPPPSEYSYSSMYASGVPPQAPSSYGYGGPSAGSEYSYGAGSSASPPPAPPSTVSDSNMTAAQRKAMQAGVSTYKPARFIVHTDVEDAYPPPNEEGVVELPPQYSERRGPINPSLGATAGTSNASYGPSSSSGPSNATYDPSSGSELAYR